MKSSEFLFCVFVLLIMVVIFGYLLPDAMEKESAIQLNHLTPTMEQDANEYYTDTD